MNDWPLFVPPSMLEEARRLCPKLDIRPVPQLPLTPPKGSKGIDGRIVSQHQICTVPAGAKVRREDPFLLVEEADGTRWRVNFYTRERAEGWPELDSPTDKELDSRSAKPASR